MKLRKELTIHKYSDNFIQIYPDLTTIERLKDILQLKEPIFERQETVFNGTTESKDLTFTNIIGFIVYVEVNGIIQLPNNYTGSTNIISYTGNVNSGDIISAVIASSEELNVAGTENTFLGLFDSPDDYIGHAEALLNVNASETAIVFSAYKTTDIQSLKNTQHSHLNISALDKVDDSGDGSKYLASDGIYKTINVSGIPQTTDDLTEGSTNLYYTNTRVDAVINTKTSDDISEGTTNLYYTSNRFDSDLSSKSTDDVSEGSTNLYFTDTRVSNNSDVSLNTTNRHSHTNKTLLDSITDSGDGSKYLSNDGNYNVIDLSGIPATTDDLTEGSINLYYSDSKVTNIITNTSINSLKDVNTTGAGNGQVLQFDGTDWKPVSISTGTGDMLKSVYDPNNVNGNTFDYNNFINIPDLSGYQTKAVYDPTSIEGDAFDYNNFTNTPDLTSYQTKLEDVNNIHFAKDASNVISTAFNFYTNVSSTSPIAYIKVDNNNDYNFEFHSMQVSGGYDRTPLTLNGENGMKAKVGVWIDEFSSDGTLTDNSDTALPTEKAVKTYVDNISIPSTTDDITEGTTNLYYTDTRVESVYVDSDDESVDTLKFAVVTALPGTTRDDTIYFVK